MNFLLSLLLICCSLTSFSQMRTIKLQNPSFEDTPRKGMANISSVFKTESKIKGWTDCGAINFPRESAPDIHPADAWDVHGEAFDGKTYLGLVVRDNESWESVGQKLTNSDGALTPILIGKCYKLSMTVARSEEYMSGSRLKLQQKGNRSQNFNYTTPTVIRIWGGNGSCDKGELLATSATVENSEWETIELDFTPTVDSDFLTIEAFYKIPVLFSYNGHVLIDNLSDIIQVECQN